MASLMRLGASTILAEWSFQGTSATWEVVTSPERLNPDEDASRSVGGMVVDSFPLASSAVITTCVCAFLTSPWLRGGSWWWRR